VLAGPVLAGVVGTGGAAATYAGWVGVRWLVDASNERRRKAAERSSVARVEVDGRGVELLSRRDLHGAFLTPGAEAGAVSLHLWRPANRHFEAQWATVEGAAARSTLSRLLVGVNSSGAASEDVESVVRVLGAEASAGDWLRKAAERGFTFAQADRWAFDYAYWNERAEAEGVDSAHRLLWQTERQRRVYREDAASRLHTLVLEVALHEESERRALEGELALLESAWREAEEIAALADRLAVERVSSPDGERRSLATKGEG
ncbi:MAG TPA: hypothetical protein VFQ39_17650, partial [Longimicrobium sp.]|nr:hypothetical protein [Longimicrobium sp.]